VRGLGLAKSWLGGSGADADAPNAKRTAFTLLLWSSLEIAANPTQKHQVDGDAQGVLRFMGNWGLDSCQRLKKMWACGFHPFTADCRAWHTSAKSGTLFSALRHEAIPESTPILFRLCKADPIQEVQKDAGRDSGVVGVEAWRQTGPRSVNESPNRAGHIRRRL